MITTAIGKAEKTGLRKVSKATNLMDRRIQHARQLFNERITRAESEYHDAMRRAVLAEVDGEAAPVTEAPVSSTAEASA